MGIREDLGTEAITLQPLKPLVTFISSDQGFQTVHGSILLPVDAGTAYALLTDYANSSNVFRNISSSRIADVEGRKELTQECKWSFLTFRGSFEVLMSVLEDRPQLALTFELIRSSFMRGFRGHWRVVPLTNPTASDAILQTPLPQQQPQQHEDSAWAPDSMRPSASMTSLPLAQGDEDADPDSLLYRSAPTSLSLGSPVSRPHSAAYSTAHGTAPGPMVGGGVRWCRVEHTLAVAPAMPLPGPIARMVQPIFVKQVTNILLDLKEGLLGNN